MSMQTPQVTTGENEAPISVSPEASCRTCPATFHVLFMQGLGKPVNANF